MEFSHSPRWSRNLLDVTGTLTAQGYLYTSKMYSPIFYVPNANGYQGLAGELYGTAPGGPTRKVTGQNIFPPEDLGNQMVLIQYRAGGSAATRWDVYAYSPALRRVRHQPQPRRGDKLAQGAESFDDICGRDTWEFSWRLLGVDTLHQTVRFPNTRPTITLADPDGTLDYMRYSVHDAHETREWSVQDQEVFFNPRVLPRVWFFAPLKSQSEVLTPEQYFLRPTLERAKFPASRKIVLSPELESKIQAQEAAGHLVFQQ